MTTTTKKPALRWWTIALLVLLGTAFVSIRIGDISTRPLWADECGQAWMVASSSLGEMYSRALQWDRNPPLFSLVLFPLTAFGNSELLLRSLSLVSGLAALLLSYAMARQWIGRFGALIYSLLWGASPAIAFYSREARPYALALLTLTAFLYMLGRHLNRPSRFSTVGLVLMAILGSLTVYTAIVVIGGCLCAALVAHGRRLPEAKVAVGLWSSLAGLGLSSAFLAKVYLSKYEGLQSTSAMYLRLPENPSWIETVAYGVNQTVQLFGYVALGEVFGARWSIALTVVGCMLIALAVLALIKGFRGEPRIRVILISLAGVITGLLVLSLLRLHPFGQGRHCLVTAPLVLLCAAAALEYLHRLLPAAAVSVAAVPVVLGLASSFRSLTPNYYVEDLPGALREAAPLMAKHDVLVVPEGSMSFEYYKHKFALAGMQVVTPNLTAPLAATKQQMLPSISSGAHYWLVLSHYTEADRMDLKQRFSPAWIRGHVVTRQGAEISRWTQATAANSARPLTPEDTPATRATWSLPSTNP